MSPEVQHVRGQFQIDCAKIRLERAGVNRLTIEGPGEIRQNAEGSLEFRFHAEDGGSLPVERFSPKVRGRLITDDEYFSLSAKEYSSTMWVASRILPNWSGSLRRGVVFGGIDRLTTEKSIRSDSDEVVIVIRIPKVIHFPVNAFTEMTRTVGKRYASESISADAAIVPIAEGELQITRDSDQTIVVFRSNSSAQLAGLPDRIAETIEFMFAEPIQLASVVRLQGTARSTTLFSFCRRDLVRARLQPPLPSNSDYEDGRFYSLFRSYLSALCKNTGAGTPLLSGHVLDVIESSTGSLRIELLGLCTGIEGLVKEGFSDLAPVSTGFKTELSQAVELIEAAQIATLLQSRIKGAINAMKSSRNEDKLRAFVDQEHLPNRLLESWKTARHSVAHGGEPNVESDEELLRIRDDILFLFYALVYASIGHKGKVINYAESGWPWVCWPLVAESL